METTSVEPMPRTESNQEPGAAAPLGFEDLKLHVGARVQVQPPAHLGKDRYTVRLLGWQPGVSVLVEAPIEANGLRLALRENDPVIVRSFSGRNAFGFTSPVRRICNYPFEYLHLAWPDQIQGMLVRKAPRARLRAIANVTLADGASIPCTIVNLSSSGAGLESLRPLSAQGDHIRVSFRLPLHDYSVVLSLTAEIRAEARPDNDASRAPVLRYGIEFVELEPQNAIFLQSFVYQCLVEDPAALT